MTAERGPERRQWTRAAVPLLVQIRRAASDPPETVYALNVSERGLFIEVDDGHPLGSRVLIQVTTPDGRERINGEGTVVRHADGGFGVHLDVDEAGRRVLRRIAEEANN